MSMLKVAAVCGIVVLASGCATLSPEARVTETAWQTLNVVDIGQTVTISRDPVHWHEDNPMLVDVAGRNPTTGKVYAAMIGSAVIHYAVTALLDEQDQGSGAWHTLNMVWQGVTLGEKGYNVASNFSEGLRPWKGEGVAK